MKTWKILWGIKIIVFMALGIGLMGFVVMHLWNWLIPVLFSGPVLTFWQALGLLVLTKILFWSFRPHGGGHWKRHHWRKRFAKKWEQMTPEEREKCRERFSGHCGWYGADEPKEEEKEAGKES